MASAYKGRDIEQIIKMRMSGAHPKDIATVMGRSKEAIDRILSIERTKRDLTYPRLMHKDTKWNIGLIEDIARKARTRPQREIAREYSVSASMISQLMHKRAIMIKESYS